MELKGDLQSLIDRASALLDGLSREIKNSNSLCNLCAQNGRFGDFADTSFEDRDKLISIRDSLKQVRDLLVFLQRLRSWQLIDRHAAFNRLEESRTILREKVKEYKGRSDDAIKELNAFDWRLNGKIKNKAVEDSKVNNNNKLKRRRTGQFIICCIRMLFEPWKWQNKAFMVAVKLAVISASISSTVRLCHAKQQYCSNPQRKVVSFVEKSSTVVIPSLSTSPLDVFYGRG
ncbi:hypothetical protein JCGZ_14295 [Jatropha curcas]|uniref:Uncharacterized protein n=1 Tax=Jatropha curcas TaxID=180498 RepID=A0A067K9N0_JATCU|nr:uncharacterized protein LOC105642887 [Jatropha curcas]KDP28524.1 hypothetical protein JCGZ_14295 [Jatropha curcas]